ncbi:hypothetical protein D9M69_704650 [compost metagenome]
MAERNAAIHAARRLLLHFTIRHWQREFAEVTNAIRCWLVLCYLPVDLKKTSNLTHYSMLLSRHRAPFQAHKFRVSI